MHERPWSLIDRFILFYLQALQMKQKDMAIDRLESRYELLCKGALGEGCSPAAYFRNKGLILQGREVDFYVGECTGKGCTGQSTRGG